MVNKAASNRLALVDSNTVVHKNQHTVQDIPKRQSTAFVLILSRAKSADAFAYILWYSSSLNSKYIGAYLVAETDANIILAPDFMATVLVGVNILAQGRLRIHFDCVGHIMGGFFELPEGRVHGLAPAADSVLLYYTQLVLINCT